METQKEARRLVGEMEYSLENANSGGLHHYNDFRSRIKDGFKLFIDEEIILERGRRHRILVAMPKSSGEKPGLIGNVIYEGKSKKYRIEEFYRVEVSVVQFPFREKDADEIEAKVRRILKEIEG